MKPVHSPPPRPNFYLIHQIIYRLYTFIENSVVPHLPQDPNWRMPNKPQPLLNFLPSLDATPARPVNEQIRRNNKTNIPPPYYFRPHLLSQLTMEENVHRRLHRTPTPLTQDRRISRPNISTSKVEFRRNAILECLPRKHNDFQWGRPLPNTPKHFPHKNKCDKSERK